MQRVVDSSEIGLMNLMSALLGLRLNVFVCSFVGFPESIKMMQKVVANNLTEAVT